MARRHLGLFGHVAHMNNGIPARDALDCALARRTKIRPPDGRKRPPGHPRRVWVQQTDCVRHPARPTSCDRSWPHNEIGAVGLQCACVLKERKI